MSGMGGTSIGLRLELFCWVMTLFLGLEDSRYRVAGLMDGTKYYGLSFRVCRSKYRQAKVAS